jgi:hypothetical protein
VSCSSNELTCVVVRGEEEGDVVGVRRTSPIMLFKVCNLVGPDHMSRRIQQYGFVFQKGPLAAMGKARQVFAGDFLVALNASMGPKL